MHIYRQNDGLPGGWFDPVEVEGYNALIRGVSRGVVVEVGTANGRSFCSIAESCRKQCLSQIGVDIQITQEFVRELQARNLRVILIQHPSIEAATLFAPESLAGVFIDADHSYSACLADLKAWHSLVRPGGFLAGHDFGGYQEASGTYDCSPHPENPAVAEAVREFFGYEPLRPGGTLWAHWKEGK